MHHRFVFRPVPMGFTLLVVAAMAQAARADEYLSGIRWERPPIVTPGTTDDAPPSDAIVLFDGTDLSRWHNGENWKVEDGVMIVGKGKIVSKDKFGDCQVHIEWSAPTPPRGSGQGRGNSGLFLMDRYEIQILDSYDNETYFDGQAGAIYKQTPPMVNAMRKPGEWNTYDIVWTAPRFGPDGTLRSPAAITAFHNGVVILNHFVLQGDTPFTRPPRYEPHPEVGPISLQDHGSPVRFRNIWVRPLVPPKGVRIRPPYIKQGDREIPVEVDPETADSVLQPGSQVK